ncbi:response regulator [Marinomonas sp. MED121]|uniref:diguanylate cyclase response regulator n=1 Tax=Marinomonas sp. MED121 TaxID=314277 RepID=UPI000069021B|nr:diguanylate cyclase response regulator [Marinomonas sp. MED121]EAQ64468.1 response regulator [Marinomonas sp. MED121]
MEAKLNETEVYRVLVVEDDDIDRVAIKRALRNQSVEYCLVFSYLMSEVKNLVENHSFDVVLTDMNLPDSAGLLTIQTIVELFPSIPVIVLSGTDSDEMALEAVHSGAQDYLHKNYLADASLITRTIRHAMERFQLKLGDEKRQEKALLSAQYDPCTKLPNRALLFDRMDQIITNAKRDRSSFTVLFIDLDEFKNVNDCFGHDAGDKVLISVATRMQHMLRESDTVSRFGGDEFVVILPNSADCLSIKKISQALIKAINLPVIIDGQSCSVGASIGVSFYPEHGVQPKRLIKNADLAMYQAKENGRNKVQVFSYDLY